MTERKPLILVVNDDGYEAKGLEAMVEIASSFGETFVVAPDRAQSGKAHAITMNEPLRLNHYKTVNGVQYWRTNGTPTDCVKLGQKVLLKNRHVDLVLSGITAVHYGKQIVGQMLEKGIPPFTCLNVNFPKASIEEIKGIKITRQTKGYWHEELEPCTDPYGGTYYWLAGYLVNTDEGEDNCEWALQHNYISVQPVHVDMTAYYAMNDIKYLENEFKR